MVDLSSSGYHGKNGHHNSGHRQSMLDLRPGHWRHDGHWSQDNKRFSMAAPGAADLPPHLRNFMVRFIFLGHDT